MLTECKKSNACNVSFNFYKKKLKTNENINGRFKYTYWILKFFLVKPFTGVLQ